MTMTVKMTDRYAKEKTVKECTWSINCFFTNYSLCKALVMDPVNQRFCVPLQKFAKDTNKTH
jgi:hypothetical protein